MALSVPLVPSSSTVSSVAVGRRVLGIAVPEELLVDSDDELDDWRRERLLPEARSDVVTCGVVVGSPAVGLRATTVTMPPTVEPAGAKRCTRPFTGGVASSVDGEESDLLPSSSSARTGWFRCWNRRSTSTSLFQTCGRAAWVRRKRSTSQVSFCKVFLVDTLQSVSNKSQSRL